MCTLKGHDIVSSRSATATTQGDHVSKTNKQTETKQKYNAEKKLVSKKAGEQWITVEVRMLPQVL